MSNIYVMILVFKLYILFFDKDDPIVLGKQQHPSILPQDPTEQLKNNHEGDVYKFDDLTIISNVKIKHLYKPTKEYPEWMVKSRDLFSTIYIKSFTFNKTDINAQNIQKVDQEMLDIKKAVELEKMNDKEKFMIDLFNGR